MKILKKLNRFYIALIVYTISIQISFAEKKVDNIWKIIETKDIVNETSTENSESTNTNTNQAVKTKLTDENIIVNNELDKSKELLAGLFDPAENDLNLDMWSNSNGKEIKTLLKKINSSDLSSFSKKIMDIALLTNSYLPQNDISSEEFQNFAIQHLIKKKDFNLIKKFIIKNPNIANKEKLVSLLADYHLSNSEIEKSCEVFDNINLVSDEYLTYLKIYCLITQDKKEEAQLLFDLNSEMNSIDNFFVKKFEVLMGYEENNYIVSDKNVLFFHLSHKTDKNFIYVPLVDSPEFIWKYLSTSNLFKNMSSVDLEDIEQIKFVEKATSEEIFDEKELLNLYKKFQFDIDQLLNAKNTYKLLPDYEGRALLYQRLLLTENIENKLTLSLKLKSSFDSANLSKAFDEELSYILKKIDEREVPINFSNFYWESREIKKLKKSKIKFNNKILHQSKVLNYFLNKTSLPKTEKDVNDLLKKIKKNKKYSFSSKDILMIESLKSDGVKISEEYDNLYEHKSNISSEIKSMIVNGETGMILLKLVEIIGKNEIENLDPKSLSNVVEIMSELKVINLRNEALLKVLPLKV
tara:strand:+ start:2525 stop:4267 length:1743 start_codon:yes stop_codon:yes gene_type:complete